MHPELQEILDSAPDVPGYGGGKWAIYSAHCCWWTSDPTAHGERVRAAGYTGIPRCPTCGSPLFQAPLDKFLEGSEQNLPPSFLPGFILAHKGEPCYQEFVEYH